MNPTETELQDMISEADINRNGIIDYEEFVTMVSRYSMECYLQYRIKISFIRKRRGSEIQEEIKETFRVFDKDGNSYISETELRQIMASVGKEIVGLVLFFLLKSNYKCYR